MNILEQFIPYLIERHNKGELPLEEMITFYSIDDYERAMRDSADGSVIKAVLKWS